MKNHHFRRLLSLAASAALLLCLLPAGAAAAGSGGIYSDITVNDDVFRAVKVLKEKGIMIGTGHGQFDADGDVTRGQAATSLYRAAGEPEVTGSAAFSDFKAGQYYSDAVIWAEEEGILQGYSDGTIQPDKSITVDEANLMISRYASLKGVSLPESLMRETVISTASGNGGGGPMGGPMGGGQGGSDQPAAPAVISRGDFAKGIYEMISTIEGRSLDLSQYMDEWVLITSDRKQNNMGQLIVDGNGNFTTLPVEPTYALMGIPYCANPEDPYVQTLDIYVPAAYVNAVPNGDGTYTVSFGDGTVTNSNGTTYSAKTAPIIYQTTIDGYKEGYSITLATDLKGTPGDITQTEETNRAAHYEDFIKAGYILTVVSSRGVDSTYATNSAPVQIVDLKAGVRYLKHNAAVMPGDTSRIIVIGGSAGGSCASLLGASGNAKVFEPYLTQIGAAMDATDDIFGVRAMATIANVHMADAAYEYLHSLETSFTGMGPNAGVTQFDEFQTALHNALINTFADYLTELGFDSSTFMDGYLDAINQSLKTYVERYVDDVEAFAAANPTLIRNGDTFTAESAASFVDTYLHRSKDIMAFDTESSGSWEAKLFSQKHFSISLLETVKSLENEYPEQAARIVSEYQDEAYADGRQDLVDMMAVVTYLTGDVDCDVAPYWHLCNSTMDGDVGSLMAYLSYKILDRDFADSVSAEFHFGFDDKSDAGHGYGDFSFDQLMAYVDADVKAG